VISEQDDWRLDAVRTQGPAQQWLQSQGTAVRAHGTAAEVAVERFYGPRCGTLLEARVIVRPTLSED
jgi:N-methylhydantoinase B